MTKLEKWKGQEHLKIRIKMINITAERLKQLEDIEV